MLVDKTIVSATNHLEFENKTFYFKMNFTKPTTKSQLSKVIENPEELDENLEFGI